MVKLPLACKRLVIWLIINHQMILLWNLILITIHFILVKKELRLASVPVRWPLMLGFRLVFQIQGVYLKFELVLLLIEWLSSFCILLKLHHWIIQIFVLLWIDVLGRWAETLVFSWLYWVFQFNLDSFSPILHNDRNCLAIRIDISYSVVKLRDIQLWIFWIPSR